MRLRRLVKRSFDILVVSIGLVLLLPLFIVIAILVKIDSPGPIIFKQHRIGENGRLFGMYKFRSMYSNIGHSIHQSHVTRLIKENTTLHGPNGNGGKSLKLQNDPRITRVGRFIRKTSLDELPQLFNVLLGEMSLVGPRPSLPYEYELYQEWHKRRLEALPGITGVWQIKGRNIVSFDEMVQMDLEYIDMQSFWLDLLILARTPKALISSQGSG